MKAEKYRFDGTKKCKLQNLPTDSKADGVNRDKILEKLSKNMVKLEETQNRFYADGKEGLIVVLQALDAAGKDSLIRRVAAGMNPQGVKVSCFKRPNPEELSHDYLWRVNKELPKRGEIAIFNRSYYEDVITASVLGLKDTYEMAPRVTGESNKKFIEKRIRQVNAYEQYLYENSYRIVKIFLHISKGEQKKRFLERIDKPDKNWKFEPADLETRDLFDKYMETYAYTISRTASPECPWYALPADDKWYTRYLFSEILLDAMEQTKPAYPELSEDVKKNLDAYKKKLLKEK